MSKQKIALNILILTALVFIVSLGWLAGHILRFSIPGIWHPPVEERIPGEKVGSAPQPPLLVERIPVTRWNVEVMPMMMLNQCKTDVYYTSLPAKCHSADGRLVRVGGIQRELIIVPYEEWEREKDFPFFTP